MIPGNHDRYTTGSVRYRQFEEWFGVFAPPGPYPWLRPLDDETAILGLDATRSHISARGCLPPEQLAKARELVADPETRPRRLIVACHYPVAAPPVYMSELAAKRMKNAAEVRRLAGAGSARTSIAAGTSTPPGRSRPPTCPASSASTPARRCSATRPACACRGSWRSTSNGDGVTVLHHAWAGTAWSIVPMHQDPSFFPATQPLAQPGVSPRRASSRSDHLGAAAIRNCARARAMALAFSSCSTSVVARRACACSSSLRGGRGVDLGRRDRAVGQDGHHVVADLGEPAVDEVAPRRAAVPDAKLAEAEAADQGGPAGQDAELAVVERQGDEVDRPRRTACARA